MDRGRSEHRRYYECRSCGRRCVPESYRASCPRCGGQLINIAVPRE